MTDQVAYCEAFDTLLGYGTDARLHYRCRRCGTVYRWQGFTAIKVGPCRAHRAPERGRGEGE